MTNLLTRITALVAAALLTGACGEGQFPEATGKGVIRGINAIPNSQALQFKIEERIIGVVALESQSNASYDDLSYNFNFDRLLLGADDVGRIATEVVDVVKDTEYTLSITGTHAAPTIVRWEQPVRTWDSGEANFGIAFGHLAASLGQVDLYFAADGVPPALGSARATLSEKGFAPEIELPGGNYVVTVTPAGDPATIIFQSGLFPTIAAASYWIVLFDPVESSTSPLGVRFMSGSDTSLPISDANSLPSTRLVHAAFGTGNIDTYINDNFSAPMFADVAFSQTTGRSDISSGSTTVTVTPTGNVGASLVDATITNGPNSIHTQLFYGVAPDYKLNNHLDNPLSINTYAKVRILQGSTNITPLDAYVVPTGTDIADQIPTFFAFPSGSATDYRAVLGRTYDIIVTRSLEKDVVGSLTGIALANGDVAEFVILDTADPNVVQLSPLP